MFALFADVGYIHCPLFIRIRMIKKTGLLAFPACTSCFSGNWRYRRRGGEGGGRLNAAENTSFHSAVRRSPNFCRDRGMAECRNVSKSSKTNTCIIDNKCSIFTVYISLKGE